MPNIYNFISCATEKNFQQLLLYIIQSLVQESFTTKSPQGYVSSTMVFLSSRSEGDSIINNMYLVEGLYSECLFEFKSILSKYIQCNFE